MDEKEKEKDIMISSIHKALDTYQVYIYNGQTEPEKKPIGQALTYISGDMRQLKSQVSENSVLLEGMRTRKKIVDSIANGFTLAKDYVVGSKLWKLVIGIASAAAALTGLWTWLKEMGVYDWLKGLF